MQKFHAQQKKQFLFSYHRQQLKEPGGIVCIYVAQAYLGPLHDAKDPW